MWFLFFFNKVYKNIEQKRYVLELVNQKRFSPTSLTGLRKSSFCLTFEQSVVNIMTAEYFLLTTRVDLIPTCIVVGDWATQ